MAALSGGKSTNHKSNYSGEGKLNITLSNNVHVSLISNRKDIRMKNSSRFSMWFQRPAWMKHNNANINLHNFLVK